MKKKFTSVLPIIAILISLWALYYTHKNTIINNQRLIFQKSQFSPILNASISNNILNIKNQNQLKDVTSYVVPYVFINISKKNTIIARIPISNFLTMKHDNDDNVNVNNPIQCNFNSHYLKDLFNSKKEVTIGSYKASISIYFNIMNTINTKPSISALHLYKLKENNKINPLISIENYNNINYEFLEYCKDVNTIPSVKIQDINSEKLLISYLTNLINSKNFNIEEKKYNLVKTHNSISLQ